MSNIVNYFVSIDSQYRDTNKYPLETDFGVSFKINDPYATYPDGSFFYPSAQQESQASNAYNPPGLNPGVGIITGSGIPYAQGTPLDSNKINPRITIDKNYNDTPFQVKGGTILQMVEVDTSSISNTKIGNYTVTFCGLIIPNYNTDISFGIIVNDVTFWTYQFIGNERNLIEYSYPFICNINYNTEGGLNRFEPGQLIIMDPSYAGSFSPPEFNKTKYVDLQYTDDKKNIYFLFDFTLESFYLARVNPNINYNNLPNYEPGLVTRLPDFYEKLNVNFNPNAQDRQISKEVSQCFLVGFNSDLNNLTEYDNFPWGSHQFFTNPNPIDILPSKNGFNQTRVDKANNIYAAIHTNPFDVNYSIATIPEPYVPLIAYLGETSASRNSKPLASTINMDSGGSSIRYRNAILCSTNITSSNLYYNVELLLLDVADVLQNPPLISPYAVSLGSVKGTNAAAFFGPKTNGVAYMALNNRPQSPPGTSSLNIYEINGILGSGNATLKVSIPLTVSAIDAYDTPLNTDFGGLPMLAVLEGNGSTIGGIILRIYKYDNSTSTLTQLASESGILAAEGSCIVNIIQTTVPDENIYIAIATIKNSSVIIYRYNTGGTLTFISQTAFPDGNLGSSTYQAQISQIYNFKGQNDITTLAVVFDQKSYIANYDGASVSPPFNFRLSGSNSNPSILDNSATYNVPFTTTTNLGTDHHYILGSNIYTSVGNVYAANALPSLLQYQIGTPIDIKSFEPYPENCWYSFMNGYYFGFTRSETNTGANRIYISQSSAYNSSDFYGNNVLISKHSYITTVNSGLTLETTPIGGSSFTYLSPIETTIPELVCPTVAGNLIFYDLSTYPIITNKYETTSIFSTSTSWTNFNTIYNNEGQGSMYIGGSDGVMTYFSNCINYTLSTIYSTTGSGSQLYTDSLDGKTYIASSLNYPYTTTGPTIEIFDVESGNLISSTVIETLSFRILCIQYMNFVNTSFGGNSDVLAIVLWDLTISKYILRFFDLNNFILFTNPNLILDIPTFYQDVRCSYSYNRYQESNDLFIETKTKINGQAIILTYHLPIDVGGLQLTDSADIDNSRLLQNLQTYGQNLSATQNFLRNQTLMSCFVANEFGGVSFVAIYDTTIIDSFVRVAEMNIGTTNPDYAQQTMFTIPSNGKTLLFVNARNGPLQGGQIIISDITNPTLAGKYKNGTRSLENAFGESINGKGTASIVSISANGTTNWINNIGDTDILPDSGIFSLEDPAYYDSQFINVTGLDIDTEQINLYMSTDWQTKIGVINPHTITGSQLILRSSNPNVSNSSILKITTSQGNSVYLTAIEGSNDVSSIDLIKGQNTIIGLNLAGTSTTIYQPQLPFSNYYIPTVIQNVVTTNISDNSAIVSFNSDTSIYNWSNKIETVNLSTKVTSNALGYNSDYLYLIGSTDSNQIDFYSNGLLTQSWIENQNEGALPKLPVPYVFISKYDYNGNYLESNIIDPFTYPNTIPSYVYVGKENIYANNIVSFARPFFYYLQRNKDGSLANFLSLDIFFTGTNSSGDINYFYTDTILSFTSRYKINSNFIDTNNKEYSTLTLYYTDEYSGFFSDAFKPYTTGPLNNIENKFVYLPTTDTNYTIRKNYFDPLTNTFNIVLNEVIPTNTIIRYFPTYTIYPNIKKANVSQAFFYNYFYIGNIANGKTYSFSEFSSNETNSLVLKTSSLVDTSLNYYLITNATTDLSQAIIPILSFSQNNSEGLYTVQIKDSSILNTDIYPGWAWITQFNPNALYTLQFYPASLTEIIYYNVRLNDLTIPNRAIRNSTITGGPRYLTDYRYIWMEVYNADDNGNPDPEIVNNTFSNNPNRDSKVIFQIPITSAGGFSNYTFLGSGQTPRLKFNPGFYNIRIRLLDPNNNVIIFENNPSPNNVEDNVFIREVDDSLMNITANLELSSIPRS